MSKQYGIFNADHTLFKGGFPTRKAAESKMERDYYTYGMFVNEQDDSQMEEHNPKGLTKVPITRKMKTFLVIVLLIAFALAVASYAAIHNEKVGVLPVVLIVLVIEELIRARRRPRR